MGLHIEWPNWNQALCESEDWRRWKYYDVKAQYDLYLRDEREEDFRELYCPECLDLFLNLITLSYDERRETRNRKWEDGINKKYGQHAFSLNNFESIKLETIPQQYEKYRWIKTEEQNFNVEKVILHPLTTQYYHEATQSYINGLFLTSILAIGVAVDQFIRQLVDPLYKYKKRIPNSIFTEAVDKKFITVKLKKEIKDFKKTIRNQVAHPKAPFTQMLGLTYKEEEREVEKEEESELDSSKKHKETKIISYWGTENGEPILIGPEPCAREGLELFWKLVHYYEFRSASGPSSINKNN